MRTKVFLFSLLLSLMTMAQSYGVYQDCSKNGKTYDVHPCVNLGLSVKWATCNVGATTPEGYGNYYAWGETSPKTDYSWNTLKYCKGSNTTLTKYCTKSEFGTVDNKTVLEKSDDAANMNWGGSWRLPTKAEFDELLSNCTKTWTSDYNGSGVKGYIYKSNKSGYTDQTIFMPAASAYYGTSLSSFTINSGIYWTSMINTSFPYLGWFLYFDYGSSGNYFSTAGNQARCCGLSVRAVCPSAMVSVTLSAKGCTSTNKIIVSPGSKIAINAWAKDHYHFAKWNDGNTSNPRTITVNANVTYTAEFAPDECKITTSATNGTVTGAGTYNYNTSVTLTATPNEHYHFVKWSDGNTSNPRTITVTKDSTFIAVFALDQFSITATGEHGSVAGSGTYNYGATATLTATNSDCYSFQKWSDGNTDNPRSVVVTQDSTFTALFVGTGYQETVNCTVVNESPYGTVSFTGTVIKDSNISLQATAPECSKFVKWSDNDTSNPRNLTVTKDSTLTAIFEKIQFNVSINTSDSIKGKVKMEEN